MRRRKRKKKVRNVVKALSVFAFSVVVYVWSSLYLTQEINKIKMHIQDLKDEIQLLEKENAQLKNDIQNLGDKEYIKEIMEGNGYEVDYDSVISVNQ